MLIQCICYYVSSSLYLPWAHDLPRQLCNKAWDLLKLLLVILNEPRVSNYESIDIAFNRTHDKHMMFKVQDLTMRHELRIQTDMCFMGLQDDCSMPWSGQLFHILFIHGLELRIDVSTGVIRVFLLIFGVVMGLIAKYWLMLERYSRSKYFGGSLSTRFLGWILWVSISMFRVYLDILTLVAKRIFYFFPIKWLG